MRATTVSPGPVIGYIRVSTEEQSLSVDAQRQALLRWCQAHQTPLRAIYEDIGVSGGTPLEKRPGLLQALQALTRDSLLLVVRRDRLARDTLTAALAERFAQHAGAHIVTVSGEGNGDGPEAQLMRTILDAFAQYEKALIVLRTKAGLARKREKAERLGMVPYGKRLAADRVHLLDHPTEQAVIATVRALRTSGLSYRAVAAELNRRGLTNRVGGRFTHTQVVRMLGTVA
jgi:DNA invertase Pin-like site-specific DNA recombinase